MLRPTALARNTVASASLTAVLALSMIAAILTGFFLNSAYAAGDFERVAMLKVCHLSMAGLAIVLGALHICANAWWYRRLCTTQPASWRGLAQNRWLTLQSILFVAVAVSGLAILCGTTGVIGFHQGCALFFTLFIAVHMATRLTVMR